jgi:hypothetical protein
MIFLKKESAAGHIFNAKTWAAVKNLAQRVPVIAQLVHIYSLL